LTLDPDFEVIKVGADIGVENFTYTGEVHGVIANPVCTKFSNVNQHRANIDDSEGMFLVDHCLRIIEEVKPKFWIIENPAAGSLKRYLGKPRAVYQPWQYGSPWTKKTALWGYFVMPEPLYETWDSVPNKLDLWTRKGRKPSILMNERTLFLLRSTADTLASLRDSNSEAYEKYNDEYFLGKSQAYSIALDNIEHILSDYDEAESE
jgi:hypothetical protein